MRISGDDIATLKRWATMWRIFSAIRRAQPTSIADWHERCLAGGPERARGSGQSHGIDEWAIAQQLAAGFEGAPVTTFWEGGRDVNVVMRLDPAIGRASRTWPTPM